VPGASRIVPVPFALLQIDSSIFAILNPSPKTLNARQTLS
jgi:hypothetical protein